jgi:hypothetical protein
MNMARRATMSITITCAQCGCRTRVAPATYVDSEALSVVCLGCETPIRAVVTLPAVEMCHGSRQSAADAAEEAAILRYFGLDLRDERNGG